MNTTIITYFIYSAIAFGVILKVGHVLYNSGAVYLKALLESDLILANNINKTLLIGYYLLNLGYVLVQLKVSSTVDSVEKMIPVLAGKLAFILLIIAVIHYINLFWMYLLANFIKRKSKNMYNLK